MSQQYKFFTLSLISLIYALLVFLLLESDTVIFGNNVPRETITDNEAVSQSFVGLQDLGDE